MRIPRRLATQAPFVVAATALPVLLVAGTAYAHVTVTGEGATRGGYATLTFRVPDETDDADTTKVQVFFPASQPLASVSVRPVPGWTARVRTTKLAHPISSDDGQVTQAVSEVTWSADSKGSSILPGQFQEFDVAAGPLPDAPTMVFKALQTYSDGTVVRWIDPSVPGQPEPDHPAPTLPLAAASAAAPATGSTGSGRATAALVLSAVAVLLGAAALVVALIRPARRRTPSPRRSPTNGP